MNPGNHNVIELLEQDSSKQTNVSEISIYTKNAPSQTDELYMNIQGNEFQYTNYQIYSLTDQTNAYFTFLPGRLIIYFGMMTLPPPSQRGPNPTPVLKLNPQIAKNIVSANFTPSVINLPPNGGNVGGFNPQPKTKEDIIPGLEVYTLYSFYYMVVCNV